jgi:hypothetical protein
MYMICMMYAVFIDNVHVYDLYDVCSIYKMKITFIIDYDSISSHVSIEWTL